MILRTELLEAQKTHNMESALENNWFSLSVTDTSIRT